MLIQNIKPYYFNNESIKYGNAVKNGNTPAEKSAGNVRLMSYPANYYILFGSNADIYKKLKNTLSANERLALFEKLTPKAQENCRETASKFKDEGLTFEDFLEACIKQPALFHQLPETIEGNVRNLAARFEDEGLKVKDYLGACIKQPALFHQLPETIESNVRNLAARFEDEGLKVKDYLGACIKQPSLFYQSPKTIEGNVRNLAARFEDEGLKVKDYLGACIKQPSLFYQSPETIEGNVRNLAARFEDEGLKVKDYLGACIKQPSLFYQSPETIEGNVRNLAARFEDEGLKVKDYLGACIKQPSLFCRLPETTAEHIKVMQFCNLNSENPLSNKEFWNKTFKLTVQLTFSTPLLMLKYLIIPKLNIPAEFRKSPLKSNFQEFLRQNPDKNYRLNVKGSEDDIKLLNECLEKSADRPDRFKVNHIKD